MPQGGWFDTQHTTLDGILSQQEHIDALVSGGESKAILVSEIVRDIQGDQGAQEDMIKALIAVLAREGSADDDIRREASGALITDPAFRALLPEHVSPLYLTYIDAVRGLSGTGSTVLGPIDALLEAGKACASAFARGVAAPNRLRGVVDSWSEVASSAEISVGNHIRHEVAVIEKMMYEALASREKDKHEAAASREGRKAEKAERAKAVPTTLDEIVRLRGEGKSNDEIRKITGLSNRAYRPIITELLESQTIRDARWRKHKK